MTNKEKTKLDSVLSSPLIFGPNRTVETLKDFIKKPKDFILPDMPTKIPPEIIEGIW